MELSKQIKLLKTLVYVYLLLLSLVGLSQILIGGTLLWNHFDFNSIVENTLWGPAALIVSLGIFAQLLCWLGWSSTRNKHKCHLALFNAFIIALVVMQGSACIWAFKLRSTLVPSSISFNAEIDKSFEDFLGKHFKKEYGHGWNRLQEQYYCCGIDGPTDYRRGAAAVPWSCCVKSENPLVAACSQVYQQGCLGKLTQAMAKLLQCATVTAFVAAVMQSVGLFCSVQLILSLKRNETDDNVDTSSMSFRQKLDRELKKPLSARTRVHRKPEPDTIQNI